MIEALRDMPFPQPCSPPADGGFLVLNDAQIGNFDLVCAIKSAYPRTRIYAQRSLSKEVRRVMSIGNAPAAPTGLMGYALRTDPSSRALAAAMDKIKAL